MKHGTLDAYLNHRCRCELCKAANAERSARRRADARLSGRCPICEQPVCGRFVHCLPCRVRNSAYQLARYHARKAPTEAVR